MPTDIFKELSEISTNRYGADIRFPIHDALAILAGDEEAVIERQSDGIPNASPAADESDISEELHKIVTEHEGAVVKQAIYDALLKLSKMQTVVVGLVGIDMSTPTSPSASDPNYVYDLTSYTSSYVTNWASLVNLMKDVSIFEENGVRTYDTVTPVYVPYDATEDESWDTDYGRYYVKNDDVYDQISTLGLATAPKTSVDDPDGNRGEYIGPYYDVGSPIITHKGFEVYVGGELFFRLEQRKTTIEGDQVDKYEATVYNTESDEFRYPVQSLTEFAVLEALAPTEAYKTENSVLINCLSNAILFTKNSAGGLSVTIGAGYDLYSGNLDSGGRILTLTNAFELSEYGGFSHMHAPGGSSTTAALTALVSEGDNLTSRKGYGVTTGRLGGSRADGLVTFGKKKLYVANSMLAIEV